MLTFLLIIIYISFISLGLPDSLLGSGWPVMYTSLGVELSSQGIVSMIIAGGTIISSFLSARVIRRFGTGLVTAVSVFMTAAALMLFSFTGSFLWLCVFAVPLGLGAGSVDAALNNYVALHYKARHMSWLHCFWGIGVTLSPVIMSCFLNAGKGWQSGYRCVSIIQLSLTAILFATLPLWKKAVPKESLNDKGAAQQNKKAPKTKELLKIPGAKAVLIAFFCYCAVESTVGLWGSSFLVMAHGFSAPDAAKYVSLYYFGITFGRFICGFLTMKFNSWKMITLGFSILGVGIAALFLPLDSLMPVALFLIGMGCAPVYPSLLQLTPENFGAELSQDLMGIQMGCAYIGSTFCPPVFGLIAQHISAGLLPLYAAVLFAVMCVGFYFLKRKRINHNTEAA